MDSLAVSSFNTESVTCQVGRQGYVTAFDLEAGWACLKSENGDRFLVSNTTSVREIARCWNTNKKVAVLFNAVYSDGAPCGAFRVIPVPAPQGDSVRLPTSVNCEITVPSSSDAGTNDILPGSIRDTTRLQCVAPTSRNFEQSDRRNFGCHTTMNISGERENGFNCEVALLEGRSPPISAKAMAAAARRSFEARTSHSSGTSSKDLLNSSQDECTLAASRERMCYSAGPSREADNWCTSAVSVGDETCSTRKTTALADAKMDVNVMKTKNVDNLPSHRNISMPRKKLGAEIFRPPGLNMPARPRTVLKDDVAVLERESKGRGDLDCSSFSSRSRIMSSSQSPVFDSNQMKSMSMSLDLAADCSKAKHFECRSPDATRSTTDNVTSPANCCAKDKRLDDSYGEFDKTGKTANKKLELAGEERETVGSVFGHGRGGFRARESVFGTVENEFPEKKQSSYLPKASDQPMVTAGSVFRGRRGRFGAHGSVFGAVKSDFPGTKQTSPSEPNVAERETETAEMDLMDYDGGANVAEELSPDRLARIEYMMKVPKYYNRTEYPFPAKAFMFPSDLPVFCEALRQPKVQGTRQLYSRRLGFWEMKNELLDKYQENCAPNVLNEMVTFMAHAPGDYRSFSFKQYPDCLRSLKNSKTYHRLSLSAEMLTAPGLEPLTTSLIRTSRFGTSYYFFDTDQDELSADMRAQHLWNFLHVCVHCGRESDPVEKPRNILQGQWFIVAYLGILLPCKRKLIIRGKPMVKLYLLLAPGDREENEKNWVGWNDIVGWVRCRDSCARTLKQKDQKWNPTLQLVLADCVFEGTEWSAKELYIMTGVFSNSGYLLPREAYALDDMVFVSQKGQNESIFFSKTINSKIVVQNRHVLAETDESQLQCVAGFENSYFGIVCPIWVNFLSLRWNALVLMKHSVMRTSSRYQLMAEEMLLKEYTEFRSN